MSAARRVARGGLAVVLGATLTTSGTSVAHAGTAGNGATPSPKVAGGEQAALALLIRAARAPRTTAYSGVQFVGTWTEAGAASSLVDVRHHPGHGTTVVVPGTTGQPDDTAYSMAASGADAAPEGDLLLLARGYRLTPAGADAVAGRAATVVDVRRDDGSSAARFWVDDATGLLLRRELYGPDGATVRASAFVSLRLAAAGSPAAVLPPPLGQPARPATPADVRAEGWPCPDHVAAGLALQEVQRMDADGREVVHARYSDGLVSVSVFQQRGRLAEGGLDGFRRAEVGGTRVWVGEGPPMRLVWSGGGKVFTVIADAPTDTVAAVVGALPAPDPLPADDLMSRMQRGLGRVGSWFSPFS